MTSSGGGQRRSSKTLTKAKLVWKRDRGHWWSAASRMHYSILNPSKTITSEKYAEQIDELHQKLQKLTPTLSLPLPLTLILLMALVNRKGPILLHDSPDCTTTPKCTISASKVEQIGLWRFASSTITTWPLTNQLPFLQASRGQLFAGKMLPQAVGDRKCFPRVHWILKHGFLRYRNK